ncbi:Family with sequence similarity 32, member A [Nesidiocoris tenuis]|uniref:Family with sequence similarity 32, member A n=1 Tax=Nesidiocoris tenuis TaxID=355587 RepID=A0ABN7B228_9HEMI|nr:Family with sequence similarity 32, member A [Nesidiocoris tenuis]
MSEYDQAVPSSLKLKNVDGGIKKKKKKKDKKEKEKLEAYAKETMKKPELQPTKAELAFQKMQEKVEMERIMKKASMTHKQRVEEFNKHLDNLTEHFDIPKVSWTK